MSFTIQPGMHPDAESLTAFAEQLLPAAEREEILAHMSTCSRCREVVFLAQQAADEVQPAPLAAVSDRPVKSRLWFDWRWMWVPAGAFAAFIGIAVVQHARKTATETQTAANVAPADSLRTARPPMEEAQKSAAQNTAKPATPAKSSGVAAERETVLQAMQSRDEGKALDANKPADRKDLALGATAPQLAPLLGVTGGSIHGMMEARARSAPIGGPSAANQFQQQSAANQQSALQSPNAQLDSVNKETANAAAPPRTESETVTLQAGKVIPTQSASMAAEVNVSPVPVQDELAKSEQAEAFRKKQKSTLPSGLEMLSAANVADRMIELDTKGALFLSEDGGKHWKSVKTQWAGRAVLVRSVTASEKGSTLAALKASPAARFELVTDGLQTWVSADGSIWTLQPLPGK